MRAGLHLIAEATLNVEPLPFERLWPCLLEE